LLLCLDNLSAFTSTLGASFLADLLAFLGSNFYSLSYFLPLLSDSSCISASSTECLDIDLLGLSLFLGVSFLYLAAYLGASLAGDIDFFTAFLTSLGLDLT